MCGSPDISSTIFEKIEKCVLFICDISIINKDSKERNKVNNLTRDILLKNIDNMIISQDKKVIINFK